MDQNGLICSYNQLAFQISVKFDQYIQDEKDYKIVCSF